MSAFSLLSIGSRAMAANYAALQTTGHNISNAGVEGYSRQRVELSTAQPQDSGAGFIGQGVDARTVVRAHDAYLSKEAVRSESVARMDEVRLQALRKLEDVFRTGELGIGHAASQFLNTMVDLANMPDDDATRQVVLSRADDVVQRFNDAGRQLDVLQDDMNASIRDAVSEVNSLARSIARANDAVLKARGSGQPPNDLLDERDRLVARLGGLVQATSMEARDGSVSVFLSGGVALVQGTATTELRTAPDESDAGRIVLAVGDEVGGLRRLDSATVTGGAIAGWLRFQNEDLFEGRALLGQIASVLAGAINEQQALGIDLRQPAGAGAPMFSLQAPRALPAAVNARNADGSFQGSVSLEVTDFRQLQASEYRLSTAADGSTWIVERLSDGLVRAVADGEEVDGFRIDFGDPPPQSGDRFLLQPVTYAAGGLGLALRDPRGIAAAASVVAQVDDGNTGSASIAQFRVSDAALDPDVPARIVFTSASGDLELQDASGAVLTTGRWTAGSPVTFDSDDPAFTGFELTLSGVPAVGDAILLSRTLHARSNNTNAQALIALRDAAFVGMRDDGVGGLAGGRTIEDAWALAVADAGVRVQGVDTAAQISRAVADQADLRRAAGAGVNLDEEAARLIQYQQTYQAAAKVLQIAQSVFDTLLQTTR
ncbi:MAG: flagellar hook-associated protein FlgK [Rubrivivax sp.]